jgi:hypothetical protein
MVADVGLFGDAIVEPLHRCCRQRPARTGVDERFGPPGFSARRFTLPSRSLTDGCAPIMRSHGSVATS